MVTLWFCGIQKVTIVFIVFFNPFISNALFLCPLKTSEHRKVFWYFQRVGEKVRYFDSPKALDNRKILNFWNWKKELLLEKCPNTKLFLVRIFLYSD